MQGFILVIFLIFLGLDVPQYKKKPLRKIPKEFLLLYI
jgi:hypothetical protein